MSRLSLDIDALEDFGRHLMVPDRDRGPVPFIMRRPQRHVVDEVARGIEEGAREYVLLKGCRQIGGTAICDVITLHWLQANRGIEGVFVSDEIDNMRYRRDVHLDMNASLPLSHRVPMRKSNEHLAAWDTIKRSDGSLIGGSRLSYQAVGKRLNTSFGRSRGYNFAHCDEVGDWPDPKAIGALRAAFSKVHPLRLYFWNSTARGDTPFRDLWETAGEVPTQRQIFIAAWMYEGFLIERPSKGCSKLVRDIWNEYATASPTEDERDWIGQVKKRYGHIVTPEHLGWWRLTLQADMGGDEALMYQEYGPLPELCFQSFGLKFIEPAKIRRLIAKVRRPAQGYVYAFGHYIEDTRVIECNPKTAPLKVWEEPEPDGVYVVAGHPYASSSPEATQYVAQVWRVWPDHMRLAAAYASEHGSTYQFAWIMMHLGGAYRTSMPTFRIIDVGATGARVLQEMQLVERFGHGISPGPTRMQIQNFLGSVSRYFYTKPDVLSSGGHIQDFKVSFDTRPWLMHSVRDQIERGSIEIPDRSLVNALAAIRQGERGDNDEIGGKGDANVITAALAVECWLKMAMPQLQRVVKPLTPDPKAPTSVEGQIVRTFMRRLATTGR